MVFAAEAPSSATRTLAEVAKVKADMAKDRDEEQQAAEAAAPPPSSCAARQCKADSDEELKPRGGCADEGQSNRDHADPEGRTCAT